MWRLILNLLLVKIGGVFSKKPRLIGGTQAKLGEFPYMAGLIQDDILFCAGSIYHSKLVLTAAHCVDETKPKELVVMVGDIYVRDRGTPSRSNLPVSQIKVHPEYNSKITSNDVAILVLGRAINEGPNVGVIPVNKDPVAEGTLCDTAGWGAYQIFDNSVSPHLLKAQFRVLAHKECADIYHIYDTSMMMCAGVKGKEIEACPGDSGGPLICNGKLTGIVSYGAGCQDKKVPTIYTNVAAFVDWISSNSHGSNGSAKRHKVENGAAKLRPKILQNIFWITISAVSNFCDQ